MAISWGAWEYSGGNGMRVGIEVDWEAVSHGEAAATATVKYYTENQYSYSDSQSLNLGGAIDGSISFSNNQGGAVTLRGTRTYTYNYPSNSYGSSPGSRTFSASLSGAYNGVTPSKSVTSNIPARPIAAPAAPTNVAVSRVSDAQQKITWTNRSTAGEPWSRVNVDKDLNDDNSWTNLVDASGGASSAADSGTAANQKIRYRVRSENSAGVSAFVETGLIFTTPSPPSSCTRTPSGADQVVTWANKTGYTEYITEVWRSVNGVWSLLTTKSAGVTSHTDVAPSTADRIKYRVRHRTNGGVQGNLYSAYSNETTETAGQTFPPLAPTNLTPSGSANLDPEKAITLSWKHNHGGDSAPQQNYEIQYRVNGGSWTTIGPNASATQSHTIAANTFANQDSVEWQVRTKGADAAYSPWSAIAQFDAVITRQIAPMLDLNTGRLEADATGHEWKNVGAAGQPAFQNSWVNYDAAGTGFEEAGFCKRGGIVYLKGLVKSGTISTTAPIFTLPLGYRPKNTRLFGTISNSAIGRIDIQPDGDVIPVTGSNAWISLDGISFPAEA